MAVVGMKVGMSVDVGAGVGAGVGVSSVNVSSTSEREPAQNTIQRPDSGDELVLCM